MRIDKQCLEDITLGVRPHCNDLVVVAYEWICISGYQTSVAKFRSFNRPCFHDGRFD